MTHNPFTPFIQAHGVVILDGAMATELERRGADIADPLWSAKVLLEAPELIRQVHYDYFAAGADVAITASYQASFAGFAARGLTRDEAAALMRLSVTLAQDARDAFWADPANRAGRTRPLVAASVGPYGAFLADGSEYRGDYGLSQAELIAFHRPRLEVLLDAGPDLLACETIPCLAEAEALCRLLSEHPAVPAWLSFACCDDAHVCHGETLAACVAAAADAANVVAVGVNCTPPRYVEPLLRSVAGTTDKLLLTYPNSGEQWDAAAKCWLPGTGVTAFAAPARLWYAAGARLIGGCCRTTPADVADMARVLRAGHDVR
ncbi:MAG: homocysteine S-methyltransferase [Caldilineaceae bacterium]|nr:homocysteine S-methyltransferase [Caldilineaceae bacterium]